MSARSIKELYSNIEFKYLWYSRGNCIIKQGEQYQSLLVILEGTVESRFSPDSVHDRLVGVVDAPYVFSPMIPFSSEPVSQTSLYALNEVLAVLLSAKTSPMNMLSNQEFFKAIMTLSARTIRNEILRIASMSTPTLRNRLQDFLKQECNREGKMLFRFNRSRSAEYLGVNRSSVSRELADMESEGLLLRQANYVQLLGDPGFWKISEPDGTSGSGSKPQKTGRKRREPDSPTKPPIKPLTKSRANDTETT